MIDAMPEFIFCENGFVVSTASAARFFGRPHGAVIAAARALGAADMFADRDEDGDVLLLSRAAFGLLTQDWPGAAPYLAAFDAVIAEQRSGGNAIVVDLMPDETLARRDH